MLFSRWLFCHNQKECESFWAFCMSATPISAPKRLKVVVNIYIYIFYSIWWKVFVFGTEICVAEIWQASILCIWVIFGIIFNHCYKKAFVTIKVYLELIFHQYLVKSFVGTKTGWTLNLKKIVLVTFSELPLFKLNFLISKTFCSISFNFNAYSVWFFKPNFKLTLISNKTNSTLALLSFQNMGWFGYKV